MGEQQAGPLTWAPQDRLMVAAVAAGMTNRQAARASGVPQSRFTRDLADLFHRTGTACRAELVARAYVDGVLNPDAWPPEAVAVEAQHVD